MSRPAHVAAFVIFISACSVDADNYTNKISTAICQQQKRCDKEWFFKNFGSIGDCVDEYQDYYYSLDHELSRCEFDEQAAKECLDAYSDSCKKAGQDSSHFDVCFDVWDC